MEDDCDMLMKTLANWTYAIDTLTKTISTDELLFHYKVAKNQILNHKWESYTPIKERVSWMITSNLDMALMCSILYGNRS